MKQIKFIFSIVITIVFIACGSQKTANKTLSKKVDYTFKKDSSKTYFTILQLNDVYEIASVQGGKYGGMARVETIHQDLLEENKNTMLVLAGDFLNPSLIGTIRVDGDRVRGKQMVEVMNAMNFDLVAFGNHEFDLSYNNLQDRLNESSFEWISANVLHNKNGQHHYFHKVVNGKKENINDSFIKEFLNPDGSILRIGFISVCIPSNPKSYVYYGDMYEEIKRAYNEIKGKVDVVLGLTHVKIEQDRKIAEMLPNIPLIIGGHEHTNKYEKVGNVVVAKADANAKTVYIHRFEYNPITKTVQLKSELKEVNKSIKSNNRVGEVVDKWQNILKTKIKEIVTNPNEIIYTTKIALDGRDTPIRSIQTNMGSMITKAMSFAYDNKVDCAIVNGGSIRIDDMLEGDINAVDIFRVLPYGGAVLKIDVKGDLLKKVLDYGKDSKGTGAYLQCYNVTKVGNDWSVQNQAINSDKTYTVAISDYLLKGLDIPFLNENNSNVYQVYRPKPTEGAYDIRRSVVNYLKKL